VATDEGWLYLADVLDLGSRRIFGFSMEDHMRTELVTKALAVAVEARGDDVWGTVFHHDRGAQYLSREFRAFCDGHGICQSVGRTGSSHDNAVAESFWATIKRELISRYRFASRAQARRLIIAWINHYNAVRRHSSLGNVPPIEWELRYARRQLLAA
jgi:transposase InsO family protein